MRLDRLVIDSGVHTFTAEFHPELTVIGGLGPSAREALAGEIIGSLAGARPGVHLELQATDRELTVFRPAQGRHRVVDTGNVADVTDEYLGSDGTIDLFAALGVDSALARRTMRLTKRHLDVRAPADSLVTQLAAADQSELWAAATRLQITEEAVERISAESGTAVTDIALVDAVEQKHAELVAATETYDRIRLISLTIADVGAIAGLALVVRDGLVGLPLLLVAAMGAFLGLFYRRRVDAATAAEREVLTATGAEDYASFHLERVNSLLDGDVERRRFMQAVTDHRHAADDWADIAGDVPVSFAVQHRDQIEAAAALRTGAGALQHLSATAPTLTEDLTGELAQALLARVEAVRALTADDESVPLVVDDPFEDLDATLKPMLLELLAAAAGTTQMILLTGDEDVTSWARIEAMTGRLAVVEPTVRKSKAPVPA